MWHYDEAYQAWAKGQQRKLNEMARWVMPERQRAIAQEMRDESREVAKGVEGSSPSPGFCQHPFRVL
jgi:hypothetical protein